MNTRKSFDMVILVVTQSCHRIGINAVHIASAYFGILSNNYVLSFKRDSIKRSIPAIAFFLNDFQSISKFVSVARFWFAKVFAVYLRLCLVFNCRLHSKPPHRIAGIYIVFSNVISFASCNIKIIIIIIISFVHCCNKETWMHLQRKH